MFKKVSKHFFPEDKKALLLIIIGTIAWSLVMVKSGLIYSFGMGFWGANGHDGLWHIALINSLARGSLEMPVFSGEVLKNYHLGFDLLAAVFYRLTRIPVRIIYFQIFPPIFAFLIGLLTFKFVYQWKKSKNAAFWSVFFVYFGGSWGWLISLVRDHGLGGDSMFWAQSSATTLINPPFALSLILLLIGLLLINRYRKLPKIWSLVLLWFVFGVLIQIKVYGGILALGGLLCLGVYDFWRQRDVKMLKVFFGSLIVSVLIFLPLNEHSSNLIIFQPFWFLETLMGFADRLNWPRYYEAMINYRASGNLIKGPIAYLIAFLFFWFGNLGTRVINSVLLVKWWKNRKKLDWEEIFMGMVIVGGIILPMFFLQKGTPWNTIQFIYYSLFFSGILAGMAFNNMIVKLQSNKILVAFFVTMTILLTLPTTFTTLGHYLPKTPPSKLSNYELGALSFLSDLPKGTVLSTQVFSRDRLNQKNIKIPIPLYLYESTAYVSAFSDKPVFMEDEMNLNIMGYNWPERKKQLLAFLKDSNNENGKRFLREINVDYIYLIKRPGVGLDEKSLNIKNIYDNEEVIIYEVL